MRVVVTGASGLLGRAVHRRLLAASHDVLALANSRADGSNHLRRLDLLDTSALTEALQLFGPDLVVHAAAERRPDVVEADPDRAHELNAEVPGRIASVCKELNRGTRMIYISTDYVFDGSRPPYQVDSDPNPLNAYGLSKLLGERAVAENGQAGMTTSLRLPVLYGDVLAPSESAVNVLSTAIRSPADSGRIFMDAYAVRYPTTVADVARVIESIAQIAIDHEKPLPPILHFQATEAMTKYDMCKLMSRLQNSHSPPLPETSVAHLDPEYEVDPKAVTARPRNCKMDVSLLKEFGVDVSHVPFETWWRNEFERQVAQREKLNFDMNPQADLQLGVTLQTPSDPSPEVTAMSTDSDHTKKEATPFLQNPATPSSPNPSFSSLRGRPTPPGTSGARSPSNSKTPSLHNVEGTVPVSANLSTLTPRSLLDATTSTHEIRTSCVHSDSSGGLRSDLPNCQMNQPTSLQPSSVLPQSVASLTQNVPGGVMRTAIGVHSSSLAETDEEIYGQPSPRFPADGDPKAPSVGVNGEHSLPIQPEPLRSPFNKENSASGKEIAKEPATLFSIKVGDPHKVGESMTGHILYTVRTQTDAPRFRAFQFSVLRRYSDFRWLHAALVHNNPGIIIPPVPEKVRGLLSRFSPELVEARRHGLERMVNKVANHPALAKDEDLCLFLESEDFSRDVRLRDASKGSVPTPEAKTWMGWSGTVGINSGHRYHEQDEWFDKQRAYLDSLEAQLKQMVKGISILAQSRKELADCIATHSHALLMLSGSSLSRSLSACFAGLGDLHSRAQELENTQSDFDVRHFGSVLYEYERVVGSVRKAFSTRIDCWHLMQKADEELRRVRTKHEKVKRESAASHYHEESLKDLAEAETCALERRAVFDLVSRRTKDEMNRFDRERVLDLRTSIDSWLGDQILRQEEILVEWHHYATKCLGIDFAEGHRAQAASQVAEATQQDSCRTNTTETS